MVVVNEDFELVVWLNPTVGMVVCYFSMVLIAIEVEDAESLMNAMVTWMKELRWVSALPMDEARKVKIEFGKGPSFCCCS